MSPTVEASFDAIALHDEDNVATSIRGLRAGESVVVQRPSGPVTLQLRDDVPLCHKVAIAIVELGDPVVKHGHIIGRAATRIEQGAYVHIHNLHGRDPAEILKKGLSD